MNGFDQPEIDALKFFLVKCMESPTGEVASIEFVNGSRSVVKARQEEIVAMMEKFKEGQWVSTRQGKYSLGPRFILELGPFARDMFPDLNECSVCMEITYKGQNCTNIECNNRMHHYCSANYFRGREVFKCNKCNTPWDEELLRTDWNFVTGPNSTMPRIIVDDEEQGGAHNNGDNDNNEGDGRRGSSSNVREERRRSRRRGNAMDDD
eukprot:Nk52_evm19s2133 gene=Nk52_evmTU19s2133